MQVVWDACNRDRDKFNSYIDGNQGGYYHGTGKARVQIIGADKVPSALQNAYTPKDAIDAWVQTNVGLIWIA
jgi:hypothetical protein